MLASPDKLHHYGMPVHLASFANAHEAFVGELLQRPLDMLPLLDEALVQAQDALLERRREEGWTAKVRADLPLRLGACALCSTCFAATAQRASNDQDSAAHG